MRISQILIFFLLFFRIYSLLGQHVPGYRWEYHEDVEAVGWSGDKLDAAKAYHQKIKTAGVLVVYQGKILAAWGDIRQRYPVHSIRKSFLSLLYGCYVDEGIIDISKTLRELGIDDVQPLTKKEKKAKVSDLLKSRSGIYHPSISNHIGFEMSMPPRHKYKPNERFFYNNWDFNVLGTIFEQETGSNIYRAFDDKIASKIGMEDFSSTDDGIKVYNPKKSLHPAYHFNMSARDMARFGYLVLNSGLWNGNQIVSKEWIKESTTPYSKNGYGYMWWVFGKPFKMISALGLGGHSIDIFPEHDLVIVIRTNTPQQQTISQEQALNLRKLIVKSKK